MEKFEQINDKIKIIKIKSGRHRISWINVNDAAIDEIDFLRKKFNFELRHLQASSAKATTQRTLMEPSANYLFLILHFPILEANNIISGEINFFIGVNYIVTIHNNNVPTINDFFNLLKKDDEEHKRLKIKNPANLLYIIMDKLMNNSYNLLDQNSLQIVKVEELIYAQESKKAVGSILALRRNIINTRRIMQNHKNIIKKSIDYFDKNDRDLLREFSELLDTSKRFWENLENQKEMIEVLNSTNESLLNFHISDIMKTLTIFSVIVFPLTLLAAIFGMNTTNGMPFIDSENGFWYVIIMMLIGCLGMLIYFARKKWL